MLNDSFHDTDLDSSQHADCLFPLMNITQYFMGPEKLTLKSEGQNEYYLKIIEYQMLRNKSFWI